MTNLQSYLFQQILTQFPKRSDAVSALTSLLNVTPDAIYRRLRGDSVLTINETALLSSHFGVSLDAFVSSARGQVIFDLHLFDQAASSLDQFMENLRQILNSLKDLTEARVLSISSNVPIFYYALTPGLFKFKLFVWANTIWNVPFLRDQQFSPQLFPPHIDQMIQRIKDDFFLVHSVELWSMSMVEDTLNQLAYFTYSGRFSHPGIVQQLYDELHVLIQTLQNFATDGSKSNVRQVLQGGFDLYHNEILHASQTFLISSKDKPLVFMPFATPSYVMTFDPVTCQHLEDWFEKIIRKSNPLSRANEKNRHFFFNQIFQKIIFSRQRLDHLLE